MKTIKIKLDRKDFILNMFNRTMIQQKLKIESNKKIYSRKNKNWKKEEVQ
jgi:hypothetical protein